MPFSRGKAALGVMLAASVVATSVAPADAAPAKPRTHKKHKRAAKRPHRIVKRYRPGNGYRCHRHFTRTRPERGTDWSSRKVRGRSITHCFRIKPKRARRTGSSAYVLPAYIVRCESGGNPRAVNYSNPNRPAGLYQIITSTWLGYGGARFAPTADQATAYEQGVIALRVKAGQGLGAWECA